jgi:UDPglucose 6-dehydrogenase
MRVAVVGVGRVGLPFAAVVSLHFPTVALDTDISLINRINARTPFEEPGLDECLRTGQLTASTDLTQVSSADLVVVCVGSQDDQAGYSPARPIAALQSIAPHLQHKKQLLCVMSTLPPSAISGEVMPLLNNSGLKDRIRGFAYTPTMIALGDAIRGFQNPSYVLVGTEEPQVGIELERFWKTLSGPELPVIQSSIAKIAVAKYVLNVALVLKISLMSLTTEFCEKYGGDVDLITEIFQKDARIAGPQMLKGGLGFGGTCFPIDVTAFIRESQRAGMLTGMLDSVHELNEYQITRTVDRVLEMGRRRVAVLGTSFKPKTGVVVNSQGLEIARRLSSSGMEVTVYDPVSLPSARTALGHAVNYAASAEEAIRQSEVIVLAVDWAEFHHLPEGIFREEQIVIDPWRMLRNSPPSARYIPYGLSSK